MQSKCCELKRTVRAGVASASWRSEKSSPLCFSPSIYKSDKYHSTEGSPPSTKKLTWKIYGCISTRKVSRLQLTGEASWQDGLTATCSSVPTTAPRSAAAAGSRLPPSHQAWIVRGTEVVVPPRKGISPPPYCSRQRGGWEA